MKTREEMAAMTCKSFHALLPDMLLDPAAVQTSARQHLAQCPACRRELDELRATMRTLDEWKAPAPSAYFDTRLAARLRAEKNAKAPGWLERMRERMLFSSDFHPRPAMAAAVALLLVLGAGSYEGVVILDHAHAQKPVVSATVNDLELMDRNATTLEQLASFENSPVAGRVPSNSD